MGLEESKINVKDDKVFSELEANQESQNVRAALALGIHTYSLSQRMFRQAFRITFEDEICPMDFMNAGRYELSASL